MEILERIQKLIKEKCGERGETSFSKIVGIPQVTLNNYVKGRRGISYEVIEAILTAFPEVSAEWLLRGEGEMLKTSSALATTDVDVSKYVNEIENLKREVAKLEGQNELLREQLGMPNKKKMESA